MNIINPTPKKNLFCIPKVLITAAVLRTGPTLVVNWGAAMLVKELPSADGWRNQGNSQSCSCTLPPPLITSTHTRTHRHTSLTCSPKRGGVCSLITEDPRKMASMLCYCLHYINSSNHTFIVVWLALMWLNTAIWLVPHWTTNCCKQSTSLFVEPGVWPARLCPHVNFTFLSLCDNCATCRLLGVHGVSFVPLSDATGTSQLVCDFKVLYHHGRSLIPTHTQLSVTCGMESWARTWEWGYQIWA